MQASQIRAWWWARQGLDGSLRSASSREVLARCGWARSVGGAGPYLALMARSGATRAAIDAEVAAAAIHELPAARGCTYVVPASDYALALAVGQGAAEAPIRQAMKFGLEAAELDRLCTAVLDALDREALDPDGIRAVVGDLARSLGPQAKAKGVGTTLPLALGRLQGLGEIRRIPTNGRLDQQRYRYTRWSPNPLRDAPEAPFTELARRYFAWVGPATPAQFQWFSGLGVKAAREALAPLGLVPLAPDDPRLIAPADLDALRATAVPAKPAYALVGSLDPLVANTRDLTTVLDAADAALTVVEDADAVALGGLSDLPSHAILDRGRLVGLWEFDPGSGAIAWRSFVGRDPALVAAVAATEAVVRNQLGDARSFSLDSPERRAPRIAALRG